MLKIIKNFFICTASGLILKLINSSVLIFSISFFSPEEYGLLSLLNTFMAIFPIFLNLGLRQAFGLDFFHLNNSQRKKMLNEIIFIYLSIASPILLIILYNLNLLNKYLFVYKVNNIILVVVLLICFTHFFVELFFQTLRYQSKIFQLSLTQIIATSIYTLIAISFLFLSNLKILGIILANLISNLIIIIYGFYLYTKKTTLQLNLVPNKEKISYYFKLGLPFVPNIFFNWLISFGDRWILAHYKNLNDVGIYSFADSFGLLFQLLILTPLTSSYVPYIFEKFSSNKQNILEIDKWNQKNMWLMMSLLFILVTCGFFLFKFFLNWLIPNKYSESINYIWLILIEQIIYLGTHFATCYLTFFKKTFYLVSLTIFTSLLNFILNIFLIPIFSINGCIIATIFSYTIYLFSLIAVTNHVKKQNDLLIGSFQVNH